MPSGNGRAAQNATDAIQPFTIRVPATALADLKKRLDLTRLPDPLQGAGWTHGTDLGYLRELIAYWRTGFDWRVQERRLNQFEQFTTTIDGLRIHFLHRRAGATATGILKRCSPKTNC